MAVRYFAVCENYTGTGVEKKVQAQAKALGNLYGFKHALIPCSLFISRLFTGQKRCVKTIKNGDLIYYRYAALNIFIHRFLLKKKKSYIIEINTKNKAELEREKGLKGILKRLFNKCYEKRLYDNAYAIVTFTPELEHYIKSISPKSNVRVIDNGYDKPCVEPRYDAVIAEKIKNFRKQGLMVTVMAATLFPWAGADKVTGILEDCSGLALVIAGTGPEMKKIMEKAAASDRIYLPGRLDAGTLAWLYESCDAGFASMALERIGIHEARPLKTREYLAYGLPVIYGYEEADYIESSPYALRFQDIAGLKEFMETILKQPGDVIKPLSWKEIYAECRDMF